MLILLILSLENPGKAQTITKPDTVKCYNQTELRRIASVFLHDQEMTRLLDITNRQLKIKLEIIDNQDTQIKILNKLKSDQEVIITSVKDQRDSAEKAYKKERRRHKLTKIAWIATTGALVISFIFILH